MNEIQARLALFATIEGGSEFWFNEISEHGCIEVRAKLLRRGYIEKVEKAERICERLTHFNFTKAMAEILEADGFLITPADQDWPTGLNDLAAPPIALIAAGVRENLLALDDSLAIVGTRNPTPYGVRVASEIATACADRSWVVISGGAYGIDSAAHKGALAGEGITLAVLASGLSQNYPAGNTRLFDQIRESGLLLSEVMPNVSAVPHRFLTRNRLIAALSRGTLVVEAAFRSGSLRTARDAAEIFRPVMAIPGPITSPASEGCHRLINERCAELVTSIADIHELVTPLSLQ
jgi:DNA processing protein